MRTSTTSFLYSEREQSVVRRYCRTFPTVFSTAQGSHLFDVEGRRFLDFFCGAGALNLGHNHPLLKQRILEYVERNGVIHALDMHTEAKEAFLHSFVDKVIRARGLPYKVQFTAPTGSDAVEAALKLARKVTKRPSFIAFHGSYHGHTAGSLAVSSVVKNKGSFDPGLPVQFLTFPAEGTQASTLQWLEDVFSGMHSGGARPAAVIIEAVQAEGGVVSADETWLRELRHLCSKYGVILICDEIQVGCFRTGTFFSFEPAGIVPDIVLLSKAISGFGLPMSLALIREDLDQWVPGEHAGTFRGNQLAFVGATAALEVLTDHAFEQVRLDGEAALTQALSENFGGTAAKLRGRGHIRGVEVSALRDPALAREVAAASFEHGLLVECAGPSAGVLKLLPPLNADRKSVV